MKKVLLFVLSLFFVVSAMAQTLNVNVVKNNDISCFGMNDGAATAMPMDGVAPYTYSWDDPMFSTTDFVTNLPAGTWNVTVTDSNSDFGYGSVTINEPMELTVDVTKQDPLCFGGFDGWATANPMGGTSPYNYSWMPTNFTQTLTNIGAGNYQVTVTDANGCIATNFTDLYDATEIVISHVIFDACSGMDNGSIDIMVSGGGSGFSYNWSNLETTEDIYNLYSGFYSVTVTDMNGCTQYGNYNVNNLPGISLFEQGSTLPTCPGNCDGTLTVMATGGVSPYIYNWDMNAGYQTTETAYNLCGGQMYGVTATDANGCTATYMPWLGNNDFYAWTNYTNPTCFNECTGQASVYYSGGASPYSYAWDSNAGNATTSTVTDLCAGMYYVTVTDFNGCMAQTWVELYNPMQITLSFYPSDPTCYGYNNGNINLDVYNGYSPYSFTWSNGQTTEDNLNIYGGNYIVTVTDGNGCQEIGSIDLYEPGEMFANPFVTDATCYGNPDGFVGVNPNGGTPPYTYYWSNGATMNNLFNVPAGNYDVNITDSKGCSLFESYMVNQPDEIILNLSATDATCGNNDGTATVSVVSGGVSPFSYDWSNANSGSNITSLYSGTYFVTVHSSDGCNVENFVNVQDIGAPYISPSSQNNVTCFGGSNGSIDITVTGGTTPYTYNWSNFETTEDLYGLTTGKYFLTVTDFAGCNGLFNVMISEPQEIKASVNVNPITCPGACNGGINFSVFGGMSPYTYYWANCTDTTFSNICAGYYQISTTSDYYNGLCEGSYQLEVFDNAGCSTVIDTFVMVNPAPMQLNFSKTDAKCFNGWDGGIDLTVTGGTAPYMYNWSNSYQMEDLYGISAGWYKVTVTDSHGCSKIDSIEVMQPTQIITNITATNPSCFGYNDGSLDLAVSGGTPPYTFGWSNFATTEDLVNVEAGYYYVDINDANNCYTYTNYDLYQPTQIDIYTSVMNANCGFSDGKAFVYVNNGGIAPFSYSWSSGSMVDSTYNVGSGTYYVTVTDVNGCFGVSYANISETGAPNISWQGWQDVKCNGGSDGSIDAYVWGGSTPYTYAWNGPNAFSASTEDITNLTSGTYFLTVTDFAGCNSIFDKIINEPEPLTIQINNVNHVTCNGQANGSIYINVTGGTPNYAYEWFYPGWGNSQYSPDIYNLDGGTYFLTVTDGNACAEVTSVVVNEPPAIVINNVTTTDVNCWNAYDGVIQIDATGGTSPLKYSISGEANFFPNNTFSTVGPGSWDVWVSDTNYCNVFAGTYVINEPSQLNADIYPTDVTCNSYNNGSVDLSVYGGTTPYNFYWSNTQTTEDISGLPGGSYNVTITDANGCQIFTGTNIYEPSAMSINFNVTNLNCYQDSSGYIESVVNGGVTPYSYMWSNGVMSYASGSVQAVYMEVTVTDANGCQVFNGITPGQPDELIVTTNSTNITCNGANDGTADAVITGGNLPYSIYWSTGQTTHDIYSLPEGTYNVTVTDSKGCNSSNFVNITNPAPLIVNIPSQTNVSCFGWNDGNAISNVSGGVSPYTYLWSNGQTSPIASGLIAGTYTLTVQDVNSCSMVSSVTITQPASALNSVFSQTNISCNGGNDGAINVTVTGGTAPYTYLWSNSMTTEDLSGISAGSYTITVTDVNGCTTTNPISLTQPSAIASTYSVGTISCYGQPGGAIDLTVSGGTTPYFYNWNTGATSQDLSSIYAGTYNVTITDANGCTDIKTITVNQPAAELTASAIPTDVPCYGSATGSIDLTPMGGTSPYTYIWSNSATSQDITNLIAGTYDVTVKDVNNCSYTTNATINQPASVITVTTSKTDATCSGSNNGSIIATVSGGTSPYIYLWSNGQTMQTATGLPMGTYTVTVTDANGCTMTATNNINEPTSLIVSEMSHTDVTCNGACDGFVNLTVTGGTTPYNYNWSNTTNMPYADMLCTGTIEVTVTDANGCYNAFSTFILDASPIAVTGTTTASSGSDGAIDITVTGGTMPYTFAWSTTEMTEDISGLPSGSYDVTVTDANLCSVSNSFVVNDISCTLTASIIGQTGVTCFGGYDGTATVEALNGTSPYTYSWDVAQSTITATGLFAGVHDVTVTDFNGCVAYANVTITEPAEIIVSEIITNSTGSDGAIDITVTGGVSPYNYTWSTTAVTEDITGLAPGTYDVTVTDANSCNTVNSYSVSDVACYLTANIISQTNAGCNSGNDGSATVEGLSGTTPYTFLWDNTMNTSTITGLTAGEYTVTVSDAVGCSATTIVTITEPMAISIGINSITPSSGSDGAIDIIVSGGITPYSFTWSNTAITEDVTGLAAGTYDVTVTDANYCMAISSFVVNDASCTLIASIIGQTNVTCFGGYDGTATVEAMSGTTPYTYAWDVAQNTATATNLQAGTHSVTVTDMNGCVALADVTISEPAEIFVLESITNSTGIDGAIDITVTGGTTPYTYLWSTTETTEDITGLAPGIYNVTITDANACTFVMSYTVNSVPCTLSATITGTNLSCYNQNDGMAVVIPSGGTTPYIYLWDNTQTTSSIGSLAAGIYSVTVTDAASCTTTATVTITEPSEIIANLTTTDITCFGANDGTGGVSVTGGVSPYTFIWPNDGMDTLLTQSVVGLIPGYNEMWVKDATNCAVITSYTINEPTAIVLTVTSHNDDSGICDGSISVSATGGTGSMTYSWSPAVSSTETASGLCAGVYSITATDVNGCIISINDTILSVGAAPVADFSASSTMIPVGGSVTFADLSTNIPAAWSWSFTGGTPSTSTLQNPTVVYNTAGTYDVSLTVSNAYGSDTKTMTGMISVQSTTLNVTTSQADVICFGGNNGSATVNVTGGTSPYTYLWSDSQTTQTAVNLTAGVYTVTVTDFNSIQGSATVTITEPTDISLTTTSSGISCNGAIDGGITATISGGVSPYTYLWSGGQTTPSISGLSAGTYDLTVTDANGCAKTTAVIITEPVSLVVSILSHTNESTVGACDGAISTSVSGGTTPYSYLWSNSSTESFIDMLCAGTYTLTVTDANGCTVTISDTITEPVCTLTASFLTVYNISCFGNNDGQATVHAADGPSPYDFEWSNGFNAYGSLIANNTSGGLSAGVISVTVTDGYGCTATVSATITEPAAINAAVSTTNVTCFGGNNGSASVTVSGGVTPYVYSWSDSQTTQTATGLYAGTYVVTITDVNGCELQKTANITEPSELIANAISTQTVCENTSIQLTANATGGVSPYTYEWSNATTGQTITYVATNSETVYVTVFDANGCQAVGFGNMIVNPLPVVSFTGLNAEYCKTNQIILLVGNHSIEGIFSGPGISGNNMFNPMNANIGVNTISYTYTDINSCTNTYYQDVIVNELPVVVASTTSATCGQANGSAQITVTGGASPYTYSTGSSTVNYLYAGNYTVTVTDSKGCKGIKPFNVNDAGAPTITITDYTPATCSMSCDATASVSITGGVTPYNIYWSNGETTNAVNNLCVGNNTVKVTDANGCVSSDEIVVDYTMPNPSIFGRISYSGGGIDGQYAEILVYSRTQHSGGGFDLLSSNSVIASDGTYVLYNFQPDEYVLYVKMTQNSPYTQIMNTYYNPDSIVVTWPSADTITLTCGQQFEANIPMYELPAYNPGSGDISGNLYYPPAGSAKKMKGIYTSFNKSMGEPIPGAQITLEQEPDDEPIAVSTTDSTGAYNFTDMPNATYGLVVEIPGFPMLSSYMVTVDDNDTLFTGLNYYVDTTANDGNIDTAFMNIGNPETSMFSVSVYPNPFKEVVHISYQLYNESTVNIELFDITGRQLDAMVNKNQPIGEYHYSINSRSLGLTPGTYIVRIISNNNVYLKKVVLNE